MENIFDHYDLLEVMEGTEKRPENDPEKSPWVRKSAQGYLLLGQALGSSQIHHIKPFQREPEKGPKAWAALKGVHAPATAAVAVVLERQMAALRIEEDEAVEEGVQKFFDLLTWLERADLNYSELQKKTKLLALLPETWSSLIINLNRDLPRLSLEDVKRAILQEDFRRRELASADGAGATSIGRGYGRGRGRGRGSLMDGLLLKAKRVEEQEEGEEEAVEAMAFAEVVLQRAEVKGMGKAMFKGSDGKMVGLKNVLWVPNLAANLISVRRLQKAGMDTSSKGAKTYTARLGERILWDLHEDRDVYNEMWQIPVVPMPKERQVAASISTKGEAVGSGDGANGRAKEIKSKKCNLGGTSKLGEHEESSAAAQKQHNDEENRKAAAEEYRENMWGTIAGAAFSNPTSAMWECDWLTLHPRMGHVALPILQQLVKNEMVAGIRVKGEPDEVLGCPTCMQAKFTRFPFSSSEVTAKAPLDEVVMDVMGPLKLGAAGAEYFLTIVDVYTRMTWVYVMSKKSDVAETVKTDWLPMVERQQDRLVKAIRTNRGGEFVSKEFSLWLKKNGIRHSLTMQYSPAMNGIAERANRTITETARGLLIEARLLNYFWPDAVRSVCVAKNRALTHVGADKWVPYVEWIGRKPKVDMLRVFGCMCMTLVAKHLRHNKLGAEAIWAVHLGMVQNSKGWLLWDPFTKKLLVSRDCKFMENLMYKDWKAENEAKIGMRFGEVKSSDAGEPATLKEALESSDAEEWKKAMESELKSIEENGTWELVELPKGRKAIRSKWLFKIKSDADGKIERYKSRLVAKGYQQKEKVDYKELFAPVVKPTTLRTLLAGAAIKGGVVKQMDVTTAFLNGVLEEEIFMAQPEGFDDGSGRVLRLKKAHYGLKQAPRQWYLKLRGVLEENGFTPSTADHSLFMLGEGEQRSFMVVYVDDILIFSPSSDLVKEVMLKLQDKFKCKALGDVRFYLGLHIERDVEKRCMRVHQRKYLEALAANFGQSEGHVATPFPSGFKCVKGPEEESVGEEERRRFHSFVGSLMYAAVNTRPDVAFATGQLARAVQCPNEEQVAAGMRVAKYLGQTPSVGLQYLAAAQRRQKGADGVEPGRLFLTAFSDASYASEPEDMTSVGEFICCVGGGPTARESKKQVDQALTLVESEYMALFRAVREIVWQRRLLAELGEEQQGPTPLYCDSQGAIALAKNPVLHGLTKHMRVKWHWTMSMVAAGEVELRYVKTTGQQADMMTKRLVEQQH
ncbi:unnamed protein product [Closterium sp. Naga37s-1]|nr:unnamed protein product [Closterium sp. Naga37s-1]